MTRCSSRRIRASRRIPLVLLAALALSLPATTMADVGQYAKDRVHDFFDIFRFRLGVPSKGRGIGVKARVTAIAQLGYVHFDGHYLGMDRRAFGLVREKRKEGGISLLYGSTHRMEEVDGNYFLDSDTEWAAVEDRRIIRNLPYWDDGRGDLLGIGAEIVTPAIAIDLGVNPSQFVDFLAGFFTIDPFRDDGLTLQRRVSTWAPLSPSEWGPDHEAPTRRENERIRNTRERIERTELERSGALSPTDAIMPAPQPTQPDTITRETERELQPRIIAPESDLDEQALDRIDRDATRIEYEPVPYMIPTEPEAEVEYEPATEVEIEPEPAPEAGEVIPEPEIDEPADELTPEEIRAATTSYQPVYVHSQPEEADDEASEPEATESETAEETEADAPAEDDESDIIEEP